MARPDAGVEATESALAGGTFAACSGWSDAGLTVAVCGEVVLASAAAAVFASQGIGVSDAVEQGSLADVRGGSGFWTGASTRFADLPAAWPVFAAGGLAMATRAGALVGDAARMGHALREVFGACRSATADNAFCFTRESATSAVELREVVARAETSSGGAADAPSASAMGGPVPEGAVTPSGGAADTPSASAMGGPVSEGAVTLAAALSRMIFPSAND